MEVSTTPARTGEAAAWLLAGLWVTLILATVPLVKPLQEWISERLGSSIFITATIVTLCASAAVAVLLSRRLRGSVKLSTVAWLVGVTAVCIWWSLQLWAPVEAIHFVEYGVLGVLLFRALRRRRGDWTVFLAAVLIGAMVGTLDEVVQWLVPRRYFAFHDISVNIGAVLAAQVVLWQVLPSDTMQRIRIGSLRLPSRLAAFQLLLLGLCLSSTPARLARLAERVPWLAFLGTVDEEMAEYGYLHAAPGIGLFRSRFTIQELHRFDSERAQEVAAIVEPYRGGGRYGEFTRIYTAARDPFAHEFRVHVHNRNRNLQLARQHRHDPALRRHHLTVAFREDQLLESFFPQTLRASQMQLRKRRQRALQEAFDPDQPFTSKAGSHLLTAFSEGQVRVGLLISLALLAGLDRWAGRRSRGVAGEDKKSREDTT